MWDNYNWDMVFLLQIYVMPVFIQSATKKGKYDFMCLLLRCSLVEKGS